MVTIVMPAYNSEKYLLNAVDSVRKQTIRAWELLIIDDCSTDETGKLAEDLARIDDRIIALHNEKNLGVGATRNRGVLEAKGDWIAFLDSDDQWEHDKLERQTELISSNPGANLVFTGSHFMDESGKLLDYVLHVPEKIDRGQLLKQNLISCSSVLVKRELMLMHPMRSQPMVHEDFAAWLEILREERYAFGIDDPLLIYRVSGKGKSGNKLKSARMNWNTYRSSGLEWAEAAKYMLHYAFRNFKKYSHIHG